MTGLRLLGLFIACYLFVGWATIKTAQDVTQVSGWKQLNRVVLVSMLITWPLIWAGWIAVKMIAWALDNGDPCYDEPAGPDYAEHLDDEADDATR